ncbi:flagellar hook-length control protein FliK [Rubripirellula sp.]|nr:flagellar hook-length control protein FliK [Rubripirellula sp.]MDB4749321.1 flagellar hook-length control protein FliK [Rubripirellula sp.]
MSDLESVRNARDATITEVAGGKLRSLARGGEQSSSEGLLDAFAEVFARMSEAKMATPTDEQPDSPEESVQAPSDSNQKSEMGFQGDGSQQQCAALKQDESLTEGVEILPTSAAEIAALKEIETQQIEEVEQFVTTDSETILAAPIAVEVSATEAETEETTEDEVRQVLPREDVEDGLGRRRKTKSTTEAKTAEVKPIEGKRYAEVVTTDDPESETVSNETEDEAGKAIEDSGGEVRRSRRNHHRQDRNGEQMPAPVSQSGRRSSAVKVDLAMNSEVLDAAGVSDRSFPTSQERSTASAVNRAVQASAIASSVASASSSNAPRFGAIAGSGIRDGAFNPSVDAATKAANRPAAESRGKKAQTTDTLARIKLIQRVSKAFQHLGPEGGVIRLRLAPAEMGSVRVEMRIQQRKVAARVVAETEAASAALREHLPDLRARLESFGMQVEKLEIETESLDQDGGSQFEDTSSRDERWQEPQRVPNRELIKQIQPEKVVDVSQHVSPSVSALNAGIDVHL